MDRISAGRLLCEKDIDRLARHELTIVEHIKLATILNNKIERIK